MSRLDYLCEPILVDDRDGFKTYFAALPEHSDPLDNFDFENTEEEGRFLYDLEHYNLVWFCAKVYTEKAGIELGSDYLGCCCYKDYEDFVKVEKSGYLSDMIHESLKEARKAAKEIAAALLE